VVSHRDWGQVPLTSPTTFGTVKRNPVPLPNPKHSDPCRALPVLFPQVLLLRPVIASNRSHSGAISTLSAVTVILHSKSESESPTLHLTVFWNRPASMTRAHKEWQMSWVPSQVQTSPVPAALSPGPSVCVAPFQICTQKFSPGLWVQYFMCLERPRPHWRLQCDRVSPLMCSGVRSLICRLGWKKQDGMVC
jgi:hypothetical protein